MIQRYQDCKDAEEMNSEQQALTAVIGVTAVILSILGIIRLIYSFTYNRYLPHTCSRCRHAVIVTDGDFSNAKCNAIITYSRQYLVSGERDLLIQNMVTCYDRRGRDVSCDHFKIRYGK